MILFQEICVVEPTDLNISLDTITASAVTTIGTIQMTGTAQNDLSVMGNSTITLQPGFSVVHGKKFTAEIVNYEDYL